MPTDRAKQQTWFLPSRVVRERSGGRCECRGECSRGHLTRCEAAQGQRGDRSGFSVMLTAAHVYAGSCATLDRVGRCSDSAHVIAVCSGCHLALDLPRHTAATVVAGEDVGPGIPDRAQSGPATLSPDEDPRAAQIPAGDYLLRKKFDGIDSWDVTVLGEDCERAFSVTLDEALQALRGSGALDLEQSLREAYAHAVRSLRKLQFCEIHDIESDASWRSCPDCGLTEKQAEVGDDHEAGCYIGDVLESPLARGVPQ